MKRWFDWLARRQTPPRSRLRERLRGYPPHDTPHAGPSFRWTDAQARENLSHLLAVRAQRLAHLVTWLDAEGIDARPLLDGGEWKPVLEALHRWANDTWPAAHDPRIGHHGVWDRTSYRGDEVVYALTFDLALLIGEAVIRRDPRYRWDVNFDEVDGRDGMASYRRVVLCADDPDSPRGAPWTEDVEGLVVHRYLHPTWVSDRLLNGWAQLVQECLARAPDPG